MLNFLASAVLAALLVLLLWMIVMVTDPKLYGHWKAVVGQQYELEMWPNE